MLLGLLPQQTNGTISNESVFAPQIMASGSHVAAECGLDAEPSYILALPTVSTIKHYE